MTAHDHDDPTSTPQQILRRQVRAAELSAAAGYFAPNQRVLDYGAGGGYVSSLIARLGCEVEAVDIETRPWKYWPVRLYDGVRLPYPDASFDVVFSCFALEHLPNLPACLSEMSRVLKRDGTMIHIVPTFSWRFWSNVTHYIWLAYQIRRLRVSSWKMLIPPPHGELTSNSVTEMIRYRLSRWRRTFSEASLDVVDERPTGVFEVAHLPFPNMSNRTRTRLARLLGSSGYVFVLRRRA